MDLTDEAGRASTRRADSALGYLPATTIADLAGTDTKVVFVARHQTTIGSRTLSRKTEKRRPRDAVWKYLRRRRYGHLRFAARRGRRLSEH
jgi:hypothetical protein